MITGRTVTNTRGGVRLDAALLDAFPGTTRAFVRDAIASGGILVAARGSEAPRPAAKGMKLRGGETIFVRELMEASDNRVAPDADVDLKCIFADGSLLAFDKPAGMSVQPLTCRETGTLMNGVVSAYPECRDLGDQPLMAGALHRIDADTSGLVLVARTAEAFAALRSQFAAQTVRKTYLALVEGVVAAGGTLENDLVHDPTVPFCRMVDAAAFAARHRERANGLRPLHAVTRFRPIAMTSEECEERTLLEVEIFTGVTHQIRAQLALAGMHIVNDRLYGAFAVENQAGHCLHALAAAFRHPAGGERTEIRTRFPSWAGFAAQTMSMQSP